MFRLVVQTARNFPKYWYVEGLASDPDNPDVPILHAWLTDGEYAFDPTWAAITQKGEHRPVPVTYWGIIMPFYPVQDFMKITGYQCVLNNAWRDRASSDKVFARAKETLEYQRQHGRLPVQERR